MLYSWRLEGFVSAAAARQIALDPRLADVSAQCVPVTDIGCLVIRTLRRPWPWGGVDLSEARRAIGNLAIEYGGLLPAKCETAFASIKDILKLVEPYSGSLAAELAGGEAPLSFSARVDWNIVAVVDAIHESGVLPRALRLPQGPLLDANKRDISASLALEIKKRRDVVLRSMQKILADCESHIHIIPSSDEKTIATLKAEFARKDTAEFNAALKLMCEELNVGLQDIQLEPGRSLGRVEIAQSAHKSVAAARALLDLPEVTTRADLKSAYYDAIKKRHPDLQGGEEVDREHIAKLHAAYETLTALCDVQGAAGPDAPVRLNVEPDDRRYRLQLVRQAGWTPPTAPSAEEDAAAQQATV